jgi:hypothetical protein
MTLLVVGNLGPLVMPGSGLLLCKLLLTTEKTAAAGGMMNQMLFRSWLSGL